MKKLLMIATAAAVLSSTTAFADAENMFYIKANVGTGKLNKITDKTISAKAKSKFIPFLGLAVGYYVMDNVRADLSLEHHFNPTLKASTTGQSARHKANITALMVNGYVDLFDVSVAKVFAGAGVGLAQLKEKITWTDATGSASVSAKKKNNLSYALTLGVTGELSQGIHGEFSYAWKDFGKTKSAVWPAAIGGGEASKTPYKGHHLAVGVRFDM